MEKSSSIVNVAKALIIFHAKVTKVSKDASNPFFKSKYASLSNILEAISTPLQESGLTFAQFPTNGNSLTTILIHAESGEYMQDTYEMRPTKDDPQGKGSAITYQRRYALAAILGLNIDEDDDGNAASGKDNKKQSEQPKTEVKKVKCTEKGINAAIVRINKGEQGLYEKMKSVFELSPRQDEVLYDAVKNAKQLQTA
jgi:hypothetical protein